MQREFHLSAEVKSCNFSIKHTGENDYIVKRYDDDGDLEDTLFFTREELMHLFLLLSKEVSGG